MDRIICTCICAYLESVVLNRCVFTPALEVIMYVKEGHVRGLNPEGSEVQVSKGLQEGPLEGTPNPNTLYTPCIVLLYPYIPR